MQLYGVPLVYGYSFSRVLGHVRTLYLPFPATPHDLLLHIGGLTSQGALHIAAGVRVSAAPWKNPDLLPLQ